VQPSAPPTESPKLTRAQRRFVKWNEGNWKAFQDEVQRLIREGDYERAAMMGVVLIEALQGTARLTASTRRLELATYVLIGLTAVLAVLTYLLWAGRF